MARRKRDYLERPELLERGWTDDLIRRFLGEADLEIWNQAGPQGVPVERFWRARVEQAEQDPKFEQAQRGIEDRRTRRQSKRRRMRERDFSQFKEYFPLARSLERRFIFFCGPTNSGKTYHALNALCEHETGAYLAPLRLLALEGQEEIERRGRMCSLITGDERELKLGAPFRAQTIESLNYEEELDAILIDEVQMLVDDQRGQHWVSALIGAPAETIYLAGSPEALSYIEQIAAYVEAELEVRYLERLAPLHADSQKRSLEEVLAREGRKAFIVFSRQGIFDIKDAVEEEGEQAAVIYGSLGPAVRRKEAERFRSGECKVLIATDAIGMGLNLPIDQLYFVTTRKWDGIKERMLTPGEIRQIAGRAGRYNKSDTGLVGAVFQAELERISQAVETPPQPLPIHPLRLGLSLPLAHELAEFRKTDSLSNVMTFFSTMKDSSGLFQPQVQQQAVALASLLDEYKEIAFDMKFRLSLAPVNTDDRALFNEYHYRVDQLVEHGRLDFSDIRDEHPSLATLLEAEQIVKVYTLQLWFAFQYADQRDIEMLEQKRDTANEAIAEFLREKARQHRKRCRVCERELPRFSSYGLCQRCFTRQRGRW